MLNVYTLKIVRKFCKKSEDLNKIEKVVNSMKILNNKESKNFEINRNNSEKTPE